MSEMRFYIFFTISYIGTFKVAKYHATVLIEYSKTYVKRPLSKRPKIGFQDQLSLNASQNCS